MYEHADLLKLQFDGNRILSCDRVCYIIANPECLLLRLPTQVNEQGISITINDTSTPFLIRFDERDCLKSPSGSAFERRDTANPTHFLKGFSPTLYDAICDFHSRHSS
jgi:hypothetical protein